MELLMRTEAKVPATIGSTWTSSVERCVTRIASFVAPNCSLTSAMSVNVSPLIVEVTAVTLIRSATTPTGRVNVFVPGPPLNVYAPVPVFALNMISSLSSLPLMVSVALKLTSNASTVMVSSPLPALIVRLVMPVTSNTWLSPGETSTMIMFAAGSSFTVMTFASFPLTATVQAVQGVSTVIGSKPEYVITSPSRDSVPDCGPVIVDTKSRTEPPARTIVSYPPAPPSTTPLIEPAASKTNVSSFAAAPTRFSKELKLTSLTPVSPAAPLTVPAPAPVIVHVLSFAGPASVSVPAPA